MYHSTYIARTQQYLASQLVNSDFQLTTRATCRKKDDFQKFLVMSVTIDIEDFQSWSEIFLEIKRHGNLKVFAAIESGNTNVHLQERKPRSLSITEPRRTQCDKMRRQVCAATESSKLQRKTIDSKHNTLEVEPRKRMNSTPQPSPTIDADKMMEDLRLTGAARNLSKERMALLYEDILKPLDIYFIFREREKQSESEDLFQ